jgi:hypothetical protein
VATATRASAGEAAIGIGGFVGIIAAVRQRSLTGWPVEQRIPLQLLPVATVAAVAFAHRPAVLAEAGVPSAAAWRLQSLSLLVFQVGIAAYRTRQFRREGVAPVFPRSLGIWVTTVVLLQCLILVLATAWPYLVGVLGLLVNGFSFFPILLFGRASEAIEPA